METTNSLIANKLTAAAAKAKADTAKEYGLEGEIADMQEPLIASKGHHSHHSKLRMLPGGNFFVPPAQRQLWGDEQILPHINWGDLFFDLFYVSAFYNLSNIYKIEVNPKNIWYFIGCFGPIMANWMDKTHYTARFEAPNDAFHRIIEILELCALGLTVLNIKSEKDMSETGTQTEMFLFSLGLAICNFFVIIRYFEIGFVWVEGGPEAKIFARLKTLIKLVPLGFFIAATAVTAMLGEDGSSSMPIILCIGGWLAQELTYFYIFGFASGNESNRGWVVPMNIPYLIHRYGEWTNLVLGESILALLTAGTSKDDKFLGDFSFFTAFFGALVLVIMLQYLYFKSQPHHAEDHALHDVHGFRAASYLILAQLYSAALILVGTCFKILMYSFSKTDGYKDKPHEELIHTIFDSAEPSDSDHSVDGLDVNQAKKHISMVYCFSLASAIVLLQLLILTHQSKTSLSRDEASGAKSVFGRFFITVTHILVVVCVAVAWKIVGTKPNALVGIGLLGVFVEVILRSFEHFLLHPGDHEGAFSNRVSIYQMQQFERNPMATNFKAVTSDVLTAVNVISALEESASNNEEVEA